MVDGGGQRIDLAQAGFNVLLTLQRLLFGRVHLCSGVFGIFCHILHAISHLIDRCGNQFHLLRLLLAVLLRLARNITEVAGSSIELAGRVEGVFDHLA